MQRGNRIVFDPFSLDLTNKCLLKGSKVIKLRPKAFAVLDYLLEHPGQVVTKEELLNAVWPGTFVGEAVLKVVIRQIREALGDDQKLPGFIETAHRRGYRFIRRVAESEQPSSGKEANRSNNAVSNSGPNGGIQAVVERDRALSRMRSWLDKMLAGERQIIFVTGEAGIGKTALVDTFTRTIASDRTIRIGQGQCLEHYGTGEAYLPVLEAIGRLGREQHQVVDVLRAHAPMWLLQMPSLVSASDRDLLTREVFGATRERMLREMGAALEALTAEMPLVLVLEDLHWSDYSTLDLISYLANQRQAARLMLIGTYRPVDVIVSGHPLKAVKRELLARQQCEELQLEYLSKEAISRYLAVRFPDQRFPSNLAELIHERTEGNPLFMVNVVDYFVAEGLIRESKEGWRLAAKIESLEVKVPDGLKQMIEKQVDHLDASQQRMLEAASVAGVEFSTLVLVEALGEDLTLVEARCDELARQRQFIQDRGVHIQPNGEAVSRFGFIHALYQNVLYERLPASRRVQLHRRIGAHLESLYGERAGEIAVELAMHFEQGANYEQAVRYLQQAADNDIRRFAYREAVALSRKGLELIARLPDTPRRTKQQLQLQLTLGVPLIAIKGYATADVGSVYMRARELCERLGETPEISRALWGLWTFRLLRGELKTSREIAEEFLRLSEHLSYPGHLMRAHMVMEVTCMHQGEFASAMEHFEKTLSLYDPERDRDDAFVYTQNPGVGMRCFAAWALWFLGKPDQAVNRVREALILARELFEPHGIAYALSFAAVLHHLRREPRMAQEYAEEGLAISTEHGLAFYKAQSTITRAGALIEAGVRGEAIEQMRQGFAAYQATGTQLLTPYFGSMLAEALGKDRKAEEGLRGLEEWVEVAHLNGNGSHLAEAYRVMGELLLTQGTSGAVSGASAGKGAFEAEHRPIAQAEAYFHQSIKIARKQRAKSWELRTVMSLARLYQNQNKREQARNLLAEIYGGFTEGFGTADLREAKELLNQLS